MLHSLIKEMMCDLDTRCYDLAKFTPLPPAPVLMTCFGDGIHLKHVVIKQQDKTSAQYVIEVGFMLPLDNLHYKSSISLRAAVALDMESKSATVRFLGPMWWAKSDESINLHASPKDGVYIVDDDSRQVRERMVNRIRGRVEAA